MPRPRRPHMPTWLNPIALGLFMIVFIVTMPAWIPVVLLLEAAKKRRLREAAKSFRCLTCGNPLGVRALKLADEAWEQATQKLRQEHPDSGFRIVRTLDAICPACGARYTFRETERTFELDAKPT